MESPSRTEQATIQSAERLPAPEIQSLLMGMILSFIQKPELPSSRGPETRFSVIRFSQTPTALFSSEAAAWESIWVRLALPRMTVATATLVQIICKTFRSRSEERRVGKEGRS